MRWVIAGVLVLVSVAASAQQTSITMLPFATLKGCLDRSHQECVKRGCGPEVLYWWQCQPLKNGKAMMFFRPGTQFDDGSLTASEKAALIGAQ